MSTHNDQKRRLWWVISPLSLYLLLFVGTARIGLWASYDQSAARTKFWLIVAAVVVYFVIAAQPARHHKWIRVGLIGVGVVTASLFLLTHDWTVLPAKFWLVNKIALAWMGIRPNLTQNIPFTFLPNITAGIVAMTWPFAAQAVWIWRSRWQRISAILTVGLLSGALVLATSRGALLGLAVGIGSWVAWQAAQAISTRIGESPRLIFSAICGAVAIFAIVATLTFPGGVGAFADQLPGPASGSGRMTLLRNSWQLAQSYLPLGAGLGTFAGLYSQYVLVIPYYFLPNAHNILLDVLLEQGVVGLIALVGIIVAAAWQLWQVSDSQPLKWATIAGGLALLTHSMVEDILYGNQAVVLLFVLVAVSTTLYRNPVALAGVAQTLRTSELQKHNIFPAPWGYWGFALVPLFVVLIGWVLPSGQARFWANRGAIEMARVQLADFPLDEWDTYAYPTELADASTYFERARSRVAHQPTASHRLGLIALQQRDFADAAGLLSVAEQQQPEHIGIRKNLAYTYVWQAEFERAAPLLKTIPEARYELDIYRWWWQTQDRPDLARNAQDVLAFLTFEGVDYARVYKK